MASWASGRGLNLTLLSDVRLKGAQQTLDGIPVTGAPLGGPQLSHASEPSLEGQGLAVVTASD